MLTTILPSVVVPSLLALAVAGAAPATPGHGDGSGAATLSARLRGAFGRAVAVGNGEVLVGEPDNSMRPGIVYVYRKGANGEWAESSRITAVDAAVGDGFGASLDLDGDRLIVGAFSQNAIANTTAWIFERSAGTWRQVAQLEREPGITGFGISVGLSGDFAFVGAPIEGGSMLTGGPGAVHVYRRNASGQWVTAGRLAASDSGPQTVFGVAVELDGPHALVASPTMGLYAFHFDGTDWRAAGKVTVDGTQPSDQLGAAIEITNGTALVGAPGHSAGAGRVFRFRFDDATGAWTVIDRLTAPGDSTTRQFFGASLALDGEQLWIGAPRTADGGAVYAFRGDAAGTWGQPQRIQPEGVVQGDGFGGTIALRGDVAAIGLTSADHGAGKAMILEREGGTVAWRASSTVMSEAESLDAVTGDEVRCTSGEAGRFSCGEIDLLAFLPISRIGGGRGVQLNDIWGWTDPQTGREYVLVGRMDGTSFVDISNPVQPVYIGDLPMTKGAQANSWRDIKVYDNHAFVVADGAGQHGMQVFDLAKLRTFNGTPITFAADTTYDRIASAHNIVINEASGFAYSVGSSSGGETCGGGLHMIDIRTPKKPTFAGCFADPQTGTSGTGYSHDAQCVMYHGPDTGYSGREICIGLNETAISIADVTDKASPKAISRATYPNVGYTHQGWFSEDQRYLYVDDELDEMNGSVNRTRTLVWDVTDLDDPQLVKEYMGETEASDHNLYIKGNLIYASNYAAGLRILDITNPVEPREVGFFDVQPFGENKPAFTGSWSNYPYFASGVIAVTGIEQGLFLLRYRRPVS